MFLKTKKWSNYQEDIIYAPKNRAAKYMKQELTELKGETDI